ncbi:toll-like receptor 4 [Mytilus californianus]|uniref:toll-like receptor 4 n=1 Tax=Mytilus californianus TaxID=6549 RepID=UPI00224579A2|nr:toll-like receptor 4 [Mytilus californianus]
MFGIKFLLLSILLNNVSSDISCSTEPKCDCIKLENGIFADCREKQLNSSPTFNENVISINLSINNLTYPPSNKNLPESLLHLNVSHNRIFNLSFDGERITFWKIIGLLTLDLSSNEILLDETFFFSNIFSNFSLLELLDVSRNVIPVDGFTNFEKVMAPLISLRFLSVDIFEKITFGRRFEKLSNLKSLKLAGVCNTSRTFIIKEDFFFNLPFLEYLDISASEVWTNIFDNFNRPCYCSLTSIHRGAIGILADLKYLDISNNRYLGLCGFRNVNRCSTITPYFFNSLPSLETLLLNDNLLGLAGTLQSRNAFFVFGSLTNLLYLDLSSNKLSSLSKNIFWNLKKIKLISLKDNLLTDLNIYLKHMSDLTFLDVSENQILYLSRNARYDISHRASRRLNIDLSKNPILCSCDSLKFLKWLQKKQRVFKDLSKYQCSNTTNYETLTDVVIILDQKCSTHTVLIMVILFLIVAFIVFLIIIIIYRKRLKLKYWYYIAKRNYFQHAYMRLEDRQRYKFDAFLSYAEEERLFIIMEVIKKLEENENLRLCIHERDFIPGCDIADNIINAIHQSRKVIFVVTPSFMKSKWCRFEQHMAYMEYAVSRQGVDCIIMVIKEKISERDIPRQMYDIMKDESYITFPDDEADQAAFWERLINSLR